MCLCLSVCISGLRHLDITPRPAQQTTLWHVLGLRLWEAGEEQGQQQLLWHQAKEDPAVQVRGGQVRETWDRRGRSCTALSIWRKQ